MNDLAAAYVLGVLEPDEHAAFERELSSSPDLQKAVAEYREVCALLALDADPEANPVNEAGWEAVQGLISRQRDHALEPRPRAAWPAAVGWIATAAASVAAVTFGLQVQDAEERLARQEAVADSVDAVLAARNAMLDDILFAQDVQIVLTSDGAVDPGVRVYWNQAQNRMVVHAFELYPTDADRVYQLWFIDSEGTVVPSETFMTQPDGHGLLTVTGPDNADGLAALAVSIEPAGGSAQPTTTPILVGAVD